MKKIIVSIVICFTSLAVFAQNISGKYDLKKVTNNSIIRNFKTNPPRQSSSRSLTRTFALDYDFIDLDYTSIVLTSYYEKYYWAINRRYPNDSSFTTRWGAVVFDSLIDFNSNPTFPYNIYPSSATQLTLDSLYIYYGHYNTSGYMDTLVITVYKNDTLNTINNTNGICAEVIWSDTIYTDTSLTGIVIGPGGDPAILGQLKYAPNLILPRGSTFSVQMDYYGPVEDRCYYLAGFRDACDGFCAANKSQVGSRFGEGNNSFSLFIYVPASGFGGFQSLNHIVSLDCNSNGIIENNLCENFYIQNINFQAIVTADILPSGNIYTREKSGCSGESILLDLSTYAFTSTPTYSWSPSIGLSDSTIEDPIATFGLYDSITYTCTISDGIDIATASITLKSINCFDGLVYQDIDSNCIYDSIDIALKNIPLLISYNTLDTFILSTDNAGRFYSYSNPIGDYLIRPDTVDLPYRVFCPSIGYDSIYMDSTTYSIHDVNFAIKCKDGFDLGTTGLIRLGIIRPITPVNLDLHVGDMANIYDIHCTNISGTISLNYTGPMYYTGVEAGTLIPDSILPNRLVWNIADFSLLDFNEAIKPNFFVDSSAIAGDLVCFTTEVSPIIGDRVPSNNTFSQCFDVRASYDPNIKEVSPSGSITSSQDWLYYTIHFQNTGNSYAENIYVWDTIDPNLNLNSIQVMGASHNQYMQVFNMNRSVRFNFININLEDSTTNEPASHGWVQYRIKPNASLVEGTNIRNTASILFDLNTPVVTNTVTTNICNTTTTVTQTRVIGEGDVVHVGTHTYSQSGSYTEILSNIHGCDSTVNTIVQVVNGQLEINAINFIIYPNPSNNQVFIQLEGIPTDKLNIVDMYGREVFESNSITNKFQINIANWSNGTYIIQCGSSRAKLVVGH